MKTQLKKYLNKHKNRIFSLIAVMVFIPIFSFYASASAIIVDLSKLYDYGTSSIDMKVYNVGSFDSNGNYTGSGYAVTKTSTGIIQSYLKFDNVNYGSVSAFEYIFLSPYNYPFLTDKYDYYFYSSIVYGLNSTYSVDRIYVRNKDGVSLIDDNTIQINNLANEYTRSCSVLAKLNIVDNFNLNSFLVIDDDGGSTVSVNSLFYVIPVPKGLSSEAVQSIISAINNQTSSLGGKIDDTNDFINFGNGSTSGIVSDNNSAIDNLDEVVSEYHATEQQFFDDFTANQQAINSDIVGWSWGGLVNCANWVGETMTDYYNNMGDFRQYIIYPLMLGIVLFFLGRGGAIIGHLFRKPTQSTVNIESTSFKRGNTRYTTTTTSKKGGVFRK